MAELSPVNSANPLTLENDVPNTAADMACVPRCPTKISEMTVDPYPNRNCKLMGMPSAKHLITPTTQRFACCVSHDHGCCGKDAHSHRKPNQSFAQVQIMQTQRLLSPDDFMTPLLPCAGADCWSVVLQILFAGCVVHRRAASDHSARPIRKVVRMTSWQGVGERCQLHMRPDRHSRQRQQRRRQQQSCRPNGRPTRKYECRAVALLVYSGKSTSAAVCLSAAC